MDRTQRLVLGVFTSMAVVLLLLPWSAAEADSVLGPETMVEAPDFDGESFKIESPRDGTYVDGSFVVELTIRDTEDGQVFDWSSNIEVDMVAVKGGPLVNVYTYDAATGGEGLHAPYNPNSEGWYDLSYILFGVVDDETTTTVEPTTTTVDQTTTIVESTTTTQGGTSTTGSETTSTTIPTEVLPTQVINTTVPAGVLPTGASTTTTIATEVMAEGELPFTGLSGLRLTALGLALLGAGVTVILTQRQKEDVG